MFETKSYVWWENMGKQYLAGGFNPSEKYESQLGCLFPIYGKMKFMFQTTNQISYGSYKTILVPRNPHESYFKSVQKSPGTT